MAMTAKVKDELSRLTVTKPCCRKAEVSAMLRGLVDPWVYFVHSYAAEGGPEVVATISYPDDFTGRPIGEPVGVAA